MSLEQWELAYCPSEKDKNRWRLKLRIEENELPQLIQSLSGVLGQPFLLEDSQFSFGFYLNEADEQNVGKLRKVLETACPNGTVKGPSREETLDAMLDKMARGLNSGKRPAPAAVPGQTVAPAAAPTPLPAPPAPSEKPPQPAAVQIQDLDLNQRYTFKEFIIGPNNRFTAAAAQAVADNPGKIYNPFFIYGGVGLGKTHMMHAVGHYVKAKNPSAKIMYVTTEKFMSEVIDALSRGALQSMREHYRQIDLLLIDDIQFLVESESTQEEFFHTFNVLHQNGKQIIITSDRPPKQLTTLEDRLRSRFEWGLIADIKSPNLETRVAILKKKEEEERLKLDDNILLYIASKLKSNIRELEGFLKRINAYASLTHQEVNMELVRTLMSDLLPVDELDEPGVSPAAPPSADSGLRSGSVPKPQQEEEIKPTPPPPSPVIPIPAPVPPPVFKIPPPDLPPAAGGEKSGDPADANLKAVEAGFFFPVGKEEELGIVKERFRDVIRKHKLKFRLESIFDRSYDFAGKINYAFFTELCKSNNVSIAIVLGVPAESSTGGEDFANLLATVMDDEKISLQLIPWAELCKDYRYLNLALDITLLKHRS